MTSNHLTRREIAVRLAGSTDSDAIRRASGRIQHWTETNILTVIDLSPNVGRGRTRTYPKEALWACAILDAMADRGATIIDMKVAVFELILPLVYGQRELSWDKGKPVWVERKKSSNTDNELPRKQNLVMAAIEGKKRILVVFRKPIVADNEPGGDQGNVVIAEAQKVEIPSAWDGGYWLDATAAFAKVR